MQRFNYIFLLLILLSFVSPGVAQSFKSINFPLHTTIANTHLITPVSTYLLPRYSLIKESHHFSIHDLKIPNTFLIDFKVNELTIFWSPNRKWKYTPFKTLSGGFKLPIGGNIEFYCCIFKTKNQFSSFNYYYNQQFISHVGFTLPINKSLKLIESIF